MQDHGMINPKWNIISHPTSKAQGSLQNENEKKLRREVINSCGDKGFS